MQAQNLIFIFLLHWNQIAQILMQILPIISPCPEIFRYRFDGIEWFGMLTIRDPNPGQPLNLNVALSVRGKPETNFLGEIELITRGQYLSDAPVLYKVKFPKTPFPPKLQQIKVNNEIVCYGSAEQALFVTQIQLEHTRKFTFMPDDTSMPLTTVGGELTMPSVTATDQNEQYEQQQMPLNDVNMQTGEMLTKNLAFGSQHLPLTKFNLLKLQAQDICGTIDNRIRFQSSKIAANKFRRAAGEQNSDTENETDDYDDDADADADDVIVDYHNDIEAFQDKKDTFVGANIPLVTTADFLQPLSNGDDDSTIRSAIEHLPSITRGAWPWLAAVYVNNLTSLFYQCGGTLISAHIVISSAHCFSTTFKNYSANELLVFLGRHNLNNWNEEGSLAASVDEIFIHPEFNRHLNTYDADIAVLVLKNAVSFNTFIRPACLWSGATNTKYIDGEQGIVVGWGSTRAQSLFNDVVPRVMEAPIVSNDVCFKANDKFNSLSSNRTFCAGIVFNERLQQQKQQQQHHISSTIKRLDKLKMKISNSNSKHQRKMMTQSHNLRNFAGPCVGDSGAGLLILKNKRWILRGIVSASLPLNIVASTSTTIIDNVNNPEEVVGTQSNSTRFACNINQYVIYTDVAKFLDWIHAFII